MTGDRATQPRRRIGILGGTFDPPHRGHVEIAAAARQQLALDEVVLVVANDPWQKASEPGRDVTPAAIRLALTEAAVAGVDGLSVSDAEIRRGGPSYTADTLAELRAAADDIFLILGSDLADQLTTWVRWEDVQREAILAVASRPGRPAAGEAVERLAGEGWRAVALEAPLLDISSTDVRRRLAAGEAVDDVISPAVMRLIQRLGLYD